MSDLSTIIPPAEGKLKEMCVAVEDLAWLVRKTIDVQLVKSHDMASLTVTKFPKSVRTKVMEHLEKSGYTVDVMNDSTGNLVWWVTFA